jgi:threonine synthase
LQTFAADYATDAEVDDYLRTTFKGGYLMDPHTATCFKAQDTCRDQPLPSIVYSTAEWTKFSPTIAHALTGETDAHDIDALNSIAQTADTPIPPIIAALFDKPIAQNTVIDKEAIEQEVLAFI